MRCYSIKGAAMRKMEENMGIFKDDEEKTTENVSLPEDLKNVSGIGDSTYNKIADAIIVN